MGKIHINWVELNFELSSYPWLRIQCHCACGAFNFSVQCAYPHSSHALTLAQRSHFPNSSSNSNLESYIFQNSHSNWVSKTESLNCYTLQYTLESILAAFFLKTRWRGRPATGAAFLLARLAAWAHLAPTRPNMLLFLYSRSHKSVRQSSAPQLSVHQVHDDWWLQISSNGYSATLSRKFV